MSPNRAAILDIELIINTAEDEALQTLRHEVARLRADGHRVTPRITFEAGDATHFAREARIRGADLVISAGGDGTLNETVNGLIDLNGLDRAEGQPALGIVPLGTGNDFAGTVGIPEDISTAIRRAVRGPTTRVDAARMNGRIFLNVSSGGLGAEATEEASDRAKRILGSVAYFVSGARKFAALRPSHAVFTANGHVVYDGPFLFFAVGNGRRAGGGNFITPRANLSDGLLDLCIVENVTHGDFLRLLPDLRAGTHAENPHVIYRQAMNIRIDPRGPITANVDGEPIDTHELYYTALPGALAISGIDAAVLQPRVPA